MRLAMFLIGLLGLIITAYGAFSKPVDSEMLEWEQELYVRRKKKRNAARTPSDSVL